MAGTREELEHEALAAYRVLTRSLLLAAADQGWVGLDLTVAQIKALFVLAESGAPATIGRVAEWLGVGLPTASHLIERLVQGELVSRSADPDDRRRMLVRLTARGEGLVDRLLGGVHYLPPLLHLLDPDDLAAFLRGVRGLNRIARQANAHPH